VTGLHLNGVNGVTLLKNVWQPHAGGGAGAGEAGGAKGGHNMYNWLLLSSGDDQCLRVVGLALRVHPETGEVKVEGEAVEVASAEGVHGSTIRGTQFTTQFTCCTSTKVQVLTVKALQGTVWRERWWCQSVQISAREHGGCLCWYPQLTCFTGAKVQILTQQSPFRRIWRPSCSRFATPPVCMRWRSGRRSGRSGEGRLVGGGVQCGGSALYAWRLRAWACKSVPYTSRVAPQLLVSVKSVSVSWRQLASVGLKLE
jgi:hypothetical protein